METGDNVVIGGFIVQGSGAKRVIIRALGPELTQYGVSDPLANPTLELHNGAGVLIASNNNWVTTIIGGIITQNQVRDIMNSGYAPSNGLESAIIADLPPGNYTAIVRGVNDMTGVGLVEVYDLDNPGTVSPSILRNISSRSRVLTGDDVMIGGFIVQGSGPKRVIVRAIGPELTQYGVQNALTDPTLELHDGRGALIASNDNWQTTVIGGIITKDQVMDIQNSGHAPTDPTESAIIAAAATGQIHRDCAWQEHHCRRCVSRSVRSGSVTGWKQLIGKRSGQGHIKKWLRSGRLKRAGNYRGDASGQPNRHPSWHKHHRRCSG